MAGRTASGVKHCLKEAKGKAALTKCGEQVHISQATIWNSEVTCGKCFPPGSMTVPKSAEPDEDIEWE